MKLKHIQMIGIEDTLTKEPDGHFSFPISLADKTGSPREMGLCLNFIFATPADAVVTNQLYLGSYIFTRKNQNDIEGQMHPAIELKPDVIWHSFGFLK